MVHNKLETVKSKYLKNKQPVFSVGDRVSIHVRLKEGEKDRIQIFKGVVISKSPKSLKGTEASFIVRKISYGIGVERLFFVHSPYIEKIKVDRSSKVKRSKLYYLRNLRGKKARLKETGRFEELILPSETPKPEEEIAAVINTPENATNDTTKQQAESLKENPDSGEGK